MKLLLHWNTYLHMARACRVVCMVASSWLYLGFIYLWWKSGCRCLCGKEVCLHERTVEAVEILAPIHTCQAVLKSMGVFEIVIFDVELAIKDGRFLRKLCLRVVQSCAWFKRTGRLSNRHGPMHHLVSASLIAVTLFPVVLGCFVEVILVVGFV